VNGDAARGMLGLGAASESSRPRDARSRAAQRVGKARADPEVEGAVGPRRGAARAAASWRGIAGPKTVHSATVQTQKSPKS
jgi:hypothetical protein